MTEPALSLLRELHIEAGTINDAAGTPVPVCLLTLVTRSAGKDHRQRVVLPRTHLPALIEMLQSAAGGSLQSGTPTSVVLQ